MSAALHAEIVALKARITKLETDNRKLQASNDYLTKLLFGQKSEALDSRQLELLMGLPPTEPPAPPLPEVEPTTAFRKRTPRVRKPRVPEDLPTEDIIIEPDAVKVAPADYRLIGEEVTVQLDVKPPVYFRRRFIRRKYVSLLNAELPPVLGKLPPRLIEGGYAGAGLLVDIILKKYADHLPLHRQEQILRSRYGIDLSRKTMCDWIGRVSDWCKPVWRHIGTELRNGDYLQIDETPVRYMKGDGGGSAKGYFWVYHDPQGGVLFEWHTGRGADCLTEMLRDFNGIAQTDGYIVYPSYANRRNKEAGEHVITLAGCMAHVRRKFFEAKEESPKVAGWILTQIRNLYGLEAEFSGQGATLRGVGRSAHSRRIMNRVHKVLLLKQKAFLPESGLGQAIDYALNRWPELMMFLEDGRLEIDNNGVERAIRPTALGKKNWLFIGHPEAGERSAILYTLLENCKRLGINPQEYLHDILTRLPSTPIPETVHLTPANWLASQKVRAA
jgi:transposase